MNLDLLIAVFLALSAAALGLRQITLSPHNETFPRAPGYVRFAMFACAAFFAFTATLFAGAASMPGDYAGPSAWAIAIIMAFVAIYNLVMTGNLFRQRYRPEVWRRLNRATETVKRSCPSLRPAPIIPMRGSPNGHQAIH